MRFWELSSFVHFPTLFMQGSTKFAFKTSSFQCPSLLLNIVLGSIIITILCIDDGIDQKSFRKKSILNIYFWLLISYFMANLSINKRAAIYFLIKTMYVTAFTWKSMGLSYYYLSLCLIFLGMDEIILSYFSSCREYSTTCTWNYNMNRNNIFQFLQVWENVKSWLVYANKLFWIAKPYFSTDIIK